MKMISTLALFVALSLAGQEARADEAADSSTIDEVVSIGSKLDQESNRIELDALSVEKPVAIDVSVSQAISAPTISLTPVALVASSND